MTLRELLIKRFLSKFDGRKLLKYALYLFLALLLQNMLLGGVRIAGVCPLVLPAAAVALGMFEGPVWGVLLSIVLGIFGDMAYVENTILFTVLFPLLSFAASFVTRFFINRRFFAFMGASLLGLLLTAVAQLLHTSVTDSFSPLMLRTVILQTLWSLPLAALAYLSPARWSQYAPISRMEES